MEYIENNSKNYNNLVFNSNIINKRLNKLHSNILNKNIYKEFSTEKSKKSKLKIQFPLNLVEKKKIPIKKKFTFNTSSFFNNSNLSHCQDNKTRNLNSNNQLSTEFSTGYHEKKQKSNNINEINLPKIANNIINLNEENNLSFGEITPKFIKKKNNISLFKKESIIEEFEKSMNNKSINKTNNKIKIENYIDSQQNDFIKKKLIKIKTFNPNRKLYKNNRKKSKLLMLKNLIDNDSNNLTSSNLNLNFPNYPNVVTSTHILDNNIIKSFAVNSFQGLIRDYNEDKVSIILSIKKPKSFKENYWPKCSFFGIYDGHGGNLCCNYLRDNLHHLIIKNEYFPNEPEKALLKGFEMAEKNFIEIAKKEEDTSGSCALICLLINDILYVANCGDSRALISLNNGKEIKLLNPIHRPNNPNEYKRIIENGGSIYNSNGIARIMPGKLSVTRALGDINAKNEELGGNSKVLINVPQITELNIKEINKDFLFIGCDGIFEHLNNDDVNKCIWNLFNEKKENYVKNIHKFCGDAVDMVMKSALRRKSLDNISAMIFCFEEMGKLFEKKEGNKNKEIMKFNSLIDKKILNLNELKFDYKKENKHMKLRLKNINKI